MAQNDFSFLPFGAGGIPANENSGTGLSAPRWYSGTAAPTSGLYYNVGDVVFNTNPSVGSPLGWLCTTSGAGGTAVFTAVGSTAGSIVSTVTATSGTLSPGTNGSALILLNPATASTYSLPEAKNQNTGSTLNLKNISANQVTLTPLASDAYQDATAITLSQNQGIDLRAVGTTVWYNELIANPPVLTTTATSGTLTNGYKLTLLNPASTGTYSLPEASANYAGWTASFVNIASSNITLTPLASDGYMAGVAAITLATKTSIMLTTDSSTNWYKAA